MRWYKITKQSIAILTLYISFTLVLHYIQGIIRGESNKSQYIEITGDGLDNFEERIATSSKSLNEEHLEESDSCTPQRYVGYLKVHKSGSTTIMNIFLRYGIRKNLTFVLPDRGKFVNLCSPGTFQLKILPKLNGEYFNILTHHARFDLSSFRDVLGPRAVFIGSLRDPLKAFQSTFNHFRLDIYRGLPSIHTFLQHPEKYENITKTFANPYTKNFQSYHYGFHRYAYVSPDDLKRKTQELESQFLLIIISEYFQESLVLLKRLL
ncbi:unnamed protein product, partial [Owenia fusiformis]